MKKRRKRALSLLEVVIAFSLAAIIVGFLFAFYRQLLEKRIPLEETRQEARCCALTQLKLGALFAGIKEEQWIDEQLPFFIDRIEAMPALVVYHHNGLEPQEAFSGLLTSAIYIAQDKLCLIDWPESGSGRSEVLFEHVKDLQFEFFNETKKDWVNEWPVPGFKDTFPLMVKVSFKYKPLRKKEKILRFCFILNKEKIG
jgi:hypothetical protein